MLGQLVPVPREMKTDRGKLQFKGQAAAPGCSSLGWLRRKSAPPDGQGNGLDWPDSISLWLQAGQL